MVRILEFILNGYVKPVKDLKQERGSTSFPLVARWGVDEEAGRSVRATALLVRGGSDLDLGK